MPQGEMGGASNQGEQSQTGAASSTNNMQSEAKGLVGQLEAMLDTYMVTKAPFALPAELKEFIVKVSPYLILIFGVIALVGVLGALGLMSVFAPVAVLGGGWGFGWGFGATVSLLATAVAIVLELVAVSGLFKRTRSAWRLVFYATIVSLAGSVLSFNGVVGGVIGAIIGWYFLFQVKEKYTN